MMRTNRRPRLATKIVLAVVAAGLLAAVIGVSGAEAASSSTLLYSTDGGATWSPTVTVAPGGTVLVRQWFDNTGNSAETAASMSTSVPAGFTLQGGSTKVCLNPSTTNPTAPSPAEQRCVGSSEASVWSGQDLQVSPSAGFYGESNGATTGELPFGRKAYLNLQGCTYFSSSSLWFNSFNPTPFDGTAYDANTDVSNTAAAGLSCGPATSIYTAQPASSGFLALALLGRRYLNLHQCTYQNSSTSAWYTSATPTPFSTASPADFDAGTNVSNTPDGALLCGPPSSGYVYQPTSSGLQALDIRDARYLNLHACVYRQNTTNSWYTSINPTPFGGTQFDANTNASNTPDAAMSCGPAPSNYTYQPNSSAFQALDLLDTTRGHGYVEYALTAPAAPTVADCDAPGPLPFTKDYAQSGSLTSTPSGAVTSSGTMTVNWAASPTDPCTGDPWPMVDPLVGGAGLVAAAATAYVVHRRRVVVA